MSKIYVAGGARERTTIVKPYVERLQQAGWEITENWAVRDQDFSYGGDHNVPITTRIAAASANFAGVFNADILWLICPGYSGARGSWAEMGIALGLRSFNHAIKIVVSGPEWQYSVFTELADHKFYTHEEGYRWLVQQVVTTAEISFSR